MRRLSPMELLEAIKFQHTVFALPFALAGMALAWLDVANRLLRHRRNAAALAEPA